MEGLNGCIFAFGCTGAGKTFSMLGPEGGRKRGVQDGVLPRTAAELFRRITQAQDDAAEAIGADGYCGFEVRASFQEVYCESTFDLLAGPLSASRDPSSACALREDPTGRVFSTATQQIVRSVEQLVDLVARGAKARATAATGVHAHSSRSHALLILSIEHRWRDVSEQDPKVFKARTSYLTLVDLAGAETMERAHGGGVDAAGVGTNMGLLVLGRVIRALAQGGSEHVPYRDSTLTRLMQSCLGGNSVTHMLACVSPAAQEAESHIRALGYATSARSVTQKPQLASVHDIANTDPMAGDVEDSDAELNRRAIWIETRGFGDVFARCLGDPEDPLILYIHGSGPKNSSMTWNDLALDIQRLAKETGKPSAFFHVAIDCPGYGRSPGDRQSIRSYPGSLISDIVTALGRKSVAALVGSSQGACATFNCALERPRLAHTLAVCHPVGHAVERYTAIEQPALLIFDTEDAGHPVAVGREMRKFLQNPRYFEFSCSTDGYWESMHMGAEVYKMISEYWSKFRQKLKGGRRDSRMPELTRVAGGFKAYSERHGDEWGPWCGQNDDIGPELAQMADAVAKSVASTSEDAWTAKLDPESNTIVYEHIRSGRRTKVRPRHARVIVERVGQQASGQEAMPAGEKSAACVLFEAEDEEDSGEEAERLAKEKAEAEHRQSEEDSQEDCDVCKKVLINPARLVNCRCAICACCAEETIMYFKQCPVCSSKVATKKNGSPECAGTQTWHNLVKSFGESDSNRREEVEAQEALLADFVKQRKKASRLVLKYGSKRDDGCQKKSWTTYVKVTKAEGDASMDAIQKVDFNINPSYSKPTATAKDMKGLGFSFEYSMAREYPCFMTVHFRPNTGIPKLSLNFWVQPDKNASKNIVIDISPDVTAGKSNTKEIQLDVEPPQDVWIKFPDGKPSLEYPGNASAKQSMEEPGISSRSTSKGKKQPQPAVPHAANAEQLQAVAASMAQLASNPESLADAMRMLTALGIDKGTTDAITKACAAGATTGAARGRAKAKVGVAKANSAIQRNRGGPGALAGGARAQSTPRTGVRSPGTPLAKPGQSPTKLPTLEPTSAVQSTGRLDSKRGKPAALRQASRPSSASSWR
eukprot:TRINITY_DN9303_c0_g1_i1.p1 TRINITY_DN9303_c0_g1~~TRINITY_DN9303_c0_g1_i1.p1  ORF type:complete len:1211 (+),score=127.57 TRINITY_DN9303_c0_g1_i1:324-3635(+)